MGKNILLVGIGGFIGSAARYLTTEIVSKMLNSAFPYSTFIANVAGCLLIGVLYGCGERYNWLSPELRLFLVTGFCGGYTTFSAFSYENVTLLQKADYLTFASYSSLSFALGLLAVWVGLSAIKILFA